MPLRPRGAASQEWIGLTEASDLLGVSPSTLRRWADAGGLKSFTTPGGHRRLSRSGILALLPADRSRRPSLERLGETPERLAQVYRREVAHQDGDLAWIRGLGEDERAVFRDHGRLITLALLSSLDAGDEGERRTLLQDGIEAAEAYGRLAATAGLPIADTVEIFLRFRWPFLRELAALARRKSLDTIETTGLLEAAGEAVDALLLATIREHAATASASARRRARARRSGAAAAAADDRARDGSSGLEHEPALEPDAAPTPAGVR